MPATHLSLNFLELAKHIIFIAILPPMYCCRTFVEREPLRVGRRAKWRGQPEVALHALVRCLFFLLVRFLLTG